MKTAARSDYVPMDVQRRNVLAVASDGVVIGLMSAAATFISVFVIRLGASALWVSLLSSLPAGIRLVMAIPWSAYAARQERSQVVFSRARLVVHVVYPLIAAIPFLLQGQAAAVAIVLCWSLIALPGSLSNIMFTVTMGRAVPRERRAFLMSRRWTFMGVAKLVSLPIASQIIERVPFPDGYQIVFAFNIVLALAAFFCISRLRIPEREIAPPEKGSPLRDRLREGLGEVIQAKAFVVFVTGRAIFNLGLATVSAIIPIYWINHLQASETWIGYFVATLSAATLISYTPWVRINRKLGRRFTLIASVLGSALYPALLALTRTPWAVLPVIAFNGLVGAGLNLAFFDALLETCPRDNQERFVAVNMTALNLMGVVGPPIGAALLGLIGVRWVLVTGTVVSLAGVAVFSFAGRNRARSAPRPEPTPAQEDETQPEPSETRSSADRAGGDNTTRSPQEFKGI